MNTVLGSIKCVDIFDNDDGTSTVIFDANPEFQKKYMELYNLEEWSQEHFQKMVTEALEKMTKEFKKEDIDE